MNNRMTITIDAMKLFMQSLPAKSQFGILSFGSDSEWMSINGQEMIKYDNSSRDSSLNQLQYFGSDFGGTDILGPLMAAFTLPQAENVKRRVFLLTDGSVGNGHEITQFIKTSCEQNDNLKVFSFGIGSGCDEQLVKNAAEAGRGDYSIVGDNNPTALKAKVVSSLKKASEPSLSGCNFQFGEQQ